MSKIVELNIVREQKSTTEQPLVNVTWVRACRDHLMVAGETLPQMAKALKGLTDKDKQELVAQFRTEFGYNIELQPSPTAA